MWIFYRLCCDKQTIAFANIYPVILHTFYTIHASDTHTLFLAQKQILYVYICLHVYYRFTIFTCLLLVRSILIWLFRHTHTCMGQKRSGQCKNTIKTYIHLIYPMLYRYFILFIFFWNFCQIQHSSSYKRTVI